MADILKFQVLPLSTNINSVPAKISDNNVILRNGKQIFLFQITMFPRRNIRKILGSQGKRNCFIV